MNEKRRNDENIDAIMQAIEILKGDIEKIEDIQKQEEFISVEDFEKKVKLGLLKKKCINVKTELEKELIGIRKKEINDLSDLKNLFKKHDTLKIMIKRALKR